MENTTDNILVVLEDKDPIDDELEAEIVDLAEEVRANENEIKSKIKKTKDFEPDEKAEAQAKSKMKRNKDSEPDNKAEAQAKKNKVSKVNVESLYSKIKNLTTTLAEIKRIKESSVKSDTLSDKILEDELSSRRDVILSSRRKLNHLQRFQHQEYGNQPYGDSQIHKNKEKKEELSSRRKFNHLQNTLLVLPSSNIQNGGLDTNTKPLTKKKRRKWLRSDSRKVFDSRG